MPTRLTPRFTLGRKPYLGASEDAHGNTIEAWGDPVDWPVFGYSSGANASPYDANREHLTHVLWTVYAPVESLPDGRDHVVLGGDEYDIDGEPRDYSHDPFGHGIGQGVVYLKAVGG